MPLDDYVDVATRIERFYEKFPEGSIQTDPATLIQTTPEDSYIAVRALAYRTPDDVRPGVGQAWEPVPAAKAMLRHSELMVAETSAVGRAIANLGFEVKAGVASREEIANRSDDAPARSQTPFEERMGQRQQQAERKRDFPAKASEVKEDIGGPKPRPEVLAVVKQLTADLGAPHLKAWFAWQELPLPDGVKLNGVALRAGEWLDREQLEIPSLIASVNEFAPEVVDA